jgi:putative transposase
MNRLFQPLLVYFLTACDHDMAQIIQFQRVENRILRSRLPKRVILTLPERRRLVKYGRELGPAIKSVITIVTLRTFARWLSGEKGSKSGQSSPRKVGRPRTPAEIRELVVRIAAETGWGATRVLGELIKLGIDIGRTTVVEILKENGLDPGPKRGESTWGEFLRRHAETLWACDFFSKKVWTASGLVDVFVLFFLHVGTRKIHIAGMTTKPDEAWMVQQARNVSMGLAEQGRLPKYLILDMDSKFTVKFRETLEADGVEMLRVGPKKPNLNPHAERFVQSIQRECLDHFVCFGEDHLRYIVERYESFYNRLRPHQGRGNRTLPVAAGEVPITVRLPKGPVRCESDLGGLLRHYYRVAA